MASANSNALAAPAAQAWHNALKIRKHVLKHVERLQVSDLTGSEITIFDKLDGIFESLRLACVQTIFFDLEYATEHKAEQTLWTLHTAVNTEYRRVLSKMKGPSHVVEKRKTERMYQNFLRVSQKFYKAYIQRLAARYDIKELRRVAQGFEAAEVAADDMVSPVPENVALLVLRSCHSTLIRLGDLSRYRVQAKYKKAAGYESAIACYALANDLIPSSGFGHHQMGIINLEEGNHLEVVYHFYRALATSEPHPNAKSNLEAKFRDLRNQNLPAPRQVSAGPRDAFSRWFVRLHALFYKGEAFSQHSELEGEVIHRLEMSAKTPDSSAILLKTALVNIAAYDIASTRFTDSKSNDQHALAFARFIMAINVRFISTICEVLANELHERTTKKEMDSKSSADQDLSPIVAQLLPTMRVYMIWLAARKAEIFTDADNASGLIPSMMHHLGKVLTLLCAEATSHEDLASCPYLLPEDIELRGLRPLDMTVVPEACRAFCDDSGELKPHRESQSITMDGQRESWARMLDILRAAYFLAEDVSVPLSYSIVSNALVFDYKVTSISESRSVLQSQSDQQATGAIGPQNVARDVSEALAGHHTSHNNSAKLQYPSVTARESNDRNENNVNHNTEETVMSMLSDFLKPPTPQQPGATSRLGPEASYGMHSDTAEEVFAEIGAQPSPGGTGPSKTFEQLPWDWLHTPTPQKKGKMNSAGEQAFARGPDPRFSPGNQAQSTVSPKDPYNTSASANAMDRQVGSSAPPVNQKDGYLPLANALTAPRTSSFSHWSPERGLSRPTPGLPSPPQQGLPYMNMPPSSHVSAFSHPSSLFQGTPFDQYNNINNINNNNNASRPSNGAVSRQSNAAGSWQSPSFVNRTNQLDNTRSSYDAAIFEAALRSSK